MSVCFVSASHDSALEGISSDLSEMTSFCLQMSCLCVVVPTLQGQSPSSLTLPGHWYNNHYELVVDEEGLQLLIQG